MTIKFRNRITLTFFIIAVTSLFLIASFTSYQFLFKTLSLPQVYTKGLSNIFIFRYNPAFVYAGIFIIMIYTCVTSFMIYHSFEKTQAPDIAFFLLFLIACLCDSSRILIPALNISGTYSKFLLKIGNIHLFARLMAPLALMGCTVLSSDTFKQNTDTNCLIFIVVAIFFAEFIPMNTAVILPNFSISYGYVKGIRLFSALLIFLSIAELFFTNQKNEYKQIITVGFGMLAIGYTLIFYCYNLVTLVSGTILLSAGTYIYLNEVHKHYLWID